MTYIRHLEKQLRTHFQRYRQAIILLGARQVGKTTLLQRLFPNAAYLLLDNAETKKALETFDIGTYKQIIGTNKQILIDELHLLSDPGRAVKILYDQIEEIQLIITGSSSFRIKNKASESMAGRKIDYSLFPLTFSEYLVQTGIEKELNFNILENIKNDNDPKAYLFNKGQVLEHVLTYGQYPETVQLASDKKYLRNLADSVIFKDIVDLALVDDKAKAKELLKLLAYQIGNLISYSELGRKISMDVRTVRRYIDIFEESFIIFRLPPYSSFGRNEIGKMPKIYFYDLGLRNALINNFDTLTLRPDSGAMFENFIITELLKIIDYTDSDYQVKYWRLRGGAEVDIVLHNPQKLYAVEVKLNGGSFSSAFRHRYPIAETRIITRENFY